jgi:hypothetical protein
LQRRREFVHAGQLLWLIAVTAFSLCRSVNPP